MIKQLNVFVENVPGRLRSVTANLLESGISIKTFSIQHRGDFGLLKLLVDKPEQAYLALCDRGFACALKDVVAVSMPDEQGSLHKLTSALAEEDMNIIDGSGVLLAGKGEGICFIELERIEETDKLMKIVERLGFEPLYDYQ